MISLPSIRSVCLEPIIHEISYDVIMVNIGVEGVCLRIRSQESRMKGARVRKQESTIAWFWWRDGKHQLPMLPPSNPDMLPCIRRIVSWLRKLGWYRLLQLSLRCNVKLVYRHGDVSMSRSMRISDLIWVTTQNRPPVSWIRWACQFVSGKVSASNSVDTHLSACTKMIWRST